MKNTEVDYEEALRSMGVIEKKHFRTAAGLEANRKINLEIIHKKDPMFAAEIAGVLAVRLCLYRPNLILPVPRGANPWGKDVAIYLKTEYAELEWQDKETGILSFATEQDQQKIIEANQIAIVEDVLTTGGSISKVAQIPEVIGKVVAAGAIWDRSNPSLPKNLEFPLESVVQSFVPLRVRT